MPVRKAVIPAAGLGTRLLPATKAVPKEMLPIVDVPTIQLVVEECVAAGIEDVLIVIGPGKRAIEEHFHPAVELEAQLEKTDQTGRLEQLRRIGSLANVHFIWQRKQLGLGDAVLCGRAFVGDEPFAVALGDAVLAGADGRPVLGQLVDAFDTTGKSVVALEEVPAEKVHRYGVAGGEVREDGLLELNALVEKPSIAEAPSRLAIAARYVLRPGIFELLEVAEPGRNNEIQLTDAMAALMRTDGMIGCQFAGKRYDIGDRADYLKASIEFALKTPGLGDDLRGYLRELLNP